MTPPSPGFVTYPTLRKVNGLDWETVTPLVYRGNRQVFTVPAGSPTDLASVPRPLAAFVPRSGASVPAAVVHDWLWRHEVPEGALTYRDADGLLRQMLRSCGVPFVLRWLMWAAVRWGALTRPGGVRGWWRDLPAVLLCTLLGLLIVAPTAVVTTVGLALQQLAEGVAWLIGRAVGQRPANPPAVTPKT